MNLANKREDTALILASRGGHVDVCRVLLEEGGADGNIPDELGKTCLMIGAEKGLVEMVDVLVEGGGDVDQTDR